MNVYILGAIGVFRECAVCGLAFRLYRGKRSKTCGACREALTEKRRNPSRNLARAYTITEEGRRALREAEAEAA